MIQNIPLGSTDTKELNYLEETLNQNNPTQYGFNMLDKIFDTGNGVIKDTEKTLQLKSLRSEIFNLRITDSKLLPKIILKIAQLSSVGFLLKLNGFEKFCHHYCKKFGFDLPENEQKKNSEKLSTSRRHVKLVEEMVKDCFLNLEELWKQLFISHSSKMIFLKKLAYSDQFSKFFKLLNSEIEHLLEVKDINKRAVELMDLREMLRQDFMDLSYHYRNLSDVKKFVSNDKVTECVYQIRRVSKDILSYLNTFRKQNGSESTLLIKYYGIGMDVIAKIDLWEIDYVKKVDHQYRQMFDMQARGGYGVANNNRIY